LLDKHTHRAKWYVFGKNTGGFTRQHDPRITDRGTIMLFDNLGSDVENGQSRVVEIDIKSRKMVGVYEAKDGGYFHSKVRGKVFLLDNRVYVQQQARKKNKPVTMFILDCPGKYISNKCKRTEIFSGDSRKYQYDNAVILNGV